MNSSEVVETSDDDELELSWENELQGSSRFSENYPPAKRRKLSHDFNSNPSPSRTPTRSSSVLCPAISSSPKSTPSSQTPSSAQTPWHSQNSNFRREMGVAHNEFEHSLSPFASPLSYKSDPPQLKNIYDDHSLPVISSSASPLPATINNVDDSSNQLMGASNGTFSIVPSSLPPFHRVSAFSPTIALAEGSKRHLDPSHNLKSPTSIGSRDLLRGSSSLFPPHPEHALVGRHSRPSTPTSLHLRSQLQTLSPDPLLISESASSHHLSPALASPTTPPRGNQRLEDLFSPGPLTPQDLPSVQHSPDRLDPFTPNHRPILPLTDKLFHDHEALSSPHNSPSHDSVTFPADSLQLTDLTPNEPHHLNDTMLDIPQNGRYRMRKRAAAQLRPYTVEKFHYTKALEANPEAILKLRDIARMRNDDYNHTNNHLDETHASWQPINETQDDSDGEWQRPRERNGHRAESSSASPVIEMQYSEFLQLSDDDEEIESTRKEAKRLERARRKAQLEQERQQAQGESDRTNAPRHRPFPIQLPSHSRQPGALRGERLPSPSATTPEVVPSGSEPPFSTPPQIPSPTFFLGSRSPSPRNDPDVQNPINISDGENDSEPSPEIEVEVHDNLPKGKGKLPKGLRILQSMYPRSMINQLGTRAHGSQSKLKTRRRRSSLSESEAEEDSGQRRGWHNHTWDKPTEAQNGQESLKEEGFLVWDFEDEDNNDDVGNASSLRDEDDAASIVELTSDSDSEVERLHPFHIEAYLAGDYIPDFKEKQASNNGSMREESLINWMLPTRIGRPRRRKTQKRRRLAVRTLDAQGHSSSKYKIDVVTQGTRKERQTRLDFSGHTGKAAKKHSRRQGSPIHARSGSFNPRCGSHRVRPALAKGYCEHEQPVAQSDIRSHRTDRKQEKADPRKRVKDNGVHVFASNGFTAISGGRKRAMITMHVEDDDEFARAIAPLASETSMPLQSARVINTALKKSASKQVLPPDRGHVLEDEAQAEERRTKSYCVDCGINVLQSGLSFKANSAIRKGWLHELISVVRCELPPSHPVSVAFHDIDLGPDVSIDVFIQSLKRIFNKLFDVVTSLVGIENADEEREWLMLQRAANQLLSWLLTSAADADAQLLCNAVQEGILELMSRLRTESFDSSSLDTFTFSICWFCVEISARLDVSSKPLASNVAFDRSVALLMKYLWVYGLDRVMVLITDGNFSKGPNLVQYVAELWVSLFHVLDCRKETGELSTRRSHPFSSFLQEVIETTSKPSEHPLKSSESIWRSIFCLCALSQFSVHGMSTSAIRIPASWNLVAHALKQIRLTVDSSADQNLSQTSLDQRDNYAGWIVKRCFLLWSRWAWQLNDVSSVFDSLSKVFQSRHFAGFYYETHDYPVFLRDNDWTSLAKFDPQDTAFSVFLKLLVQAVGCDESNPQRSLSPKAKKMLSMAFSVTKIPFSKTTPTTVQYLSTLHNRLATIAVGIYLEPTSHEQRLKTARTYVNFSDTDKTARLWVIHGMTCLAIILRSSKLSMDGIAVWVEEMAAAMRNEYEALNPPSELDVENLIQLRLEVNLLADAVRKIMDTYKSNSEYPEPRLLQAFKPVLKIFIDGELATIREVLRMLQLFLDARKKALPPPERPGRRLPTAESQESQDEYSMTDDLDYDDPILLAALDNIGGANGSSNDTDDIPAKEANLKLCLTDNPNLFWWVWRNLYKRVSMCTLPIHDSDWFLIELCTRCWLGCADALVHSGNNTMTWSSVMKVMGDNWKGIQDAFRRRLDLTVMKTLLQLDPMTYLDYPNEYLESLVTTLVSTDPGYDRDFIRLFFDIDRCQPQHLIVGVLNHTDGNDSNNHPAERPPAEILEAIINNISLRLEDETTPEQDRLIDLCIKMFQAMKHNSSELATASPEKLQYDIWCQGIAQKVHAHVRHERLASWISWTRGLGQK